MGRRDFATMGGLPRKYVAALNQTTGASTAWNPPPNDSVLTVTVTDKTIYLGGYFTQMGDDYAIGIADFDRITGALTDWSPFVTGSVSAIAAFDDWVYVGGFFYEVDGLRTYLDSKYRPNLAVFPPWGFPVITLQPRSQLLSPGETAHFEVEALANLPRTYQWQLNGVDLRGATNNALTISNLSPNLAGTYTVIVSNSFGRALSAEAVLTVFAPVIITNQPVSQTVAPGTTITLRVGATGSPPPFFQWRLNGVNIPTATAPTLTLPAAQPTAGGSYDVLVGNIGGAVKSELVTSASLPFVDRLADRTVLESTAGVGSGSNTNATADGSEPRHAGKAGGKSLWLSWRAPARGIAHFRTRGSDFDTLLAVYTGTDVANLTEMVSDDDRGGFLTSEVAFNVTAGTEYQIAVDGFGTASGNIVLSWSLDVSNPDLPRIITPPLSQTVPAGATVVFSALVSSATPVSYQWLYNCAPIPFATNASVTITNVQPGQVGVYTVEVRNSGAQKVESAPAFLEIGADPKARSRDKFQDLFAEPETPLVAQSLARGRPAGFPSVTAGVLGIQNLNNFEATTELDELLHAGVIGGSSRWFKLTAVDSGVMMIDTLGSDIDTVLAVYTGTTLRTLKLVASDNNGASDRLRSVVRFPAVAGQSYLIAVDGVNGVQGNIKINWILGGPPAITGWGRATAGAFRLEVAEGQSSLIIQASTNLADWLPVFTNTGPGGRIEFIDLQSTNYPRRFYRVRQ